ncbi:cell death in tomato 1 [Paraphoma chrysanthemicola]|nr:cell death in tomato 1 [Paraphoma chrysanthemicola]
MQLTPTSLAAILAFTSTSLAAPFTPRQSPLQSFQVTSVGVGTPSGRPESYPWASITASITDPNEINFGPSEADGKDVIVPAGSKGINCVAKYFTRYPAEPPTGRKWPCDPVEKGYWTMEVLPGTSGSYASGDFKLKFTHVADALYLGKQYTASFVAEGGFKVGDNLSGSCGGSGVCGWGLAPGKSPVEIAPTKV